MCGRFSLDLDTDALVQEFVAQHNRFPEWAPSWNIAPTSTIPIVVERNPGVTEIGPARWSLIPSWSKEPNSRYPTFNARSETAAQKPTFREAVKHHRCLVPVSGYYEWVTVAGTKTPHYIHDPLARVFSLAGLYSWWHNPSTNEMIATATILTRQAAPALFHIHPRMPIVVASEHYSRWLNPEDHEGAALITALSDHSLSASERLTYYPIAPLRGDGEALIRPLASEV